MRLPINWLLDHIKLNCDAQTIIKTLPYMGIEVNQVINMHDLLKDLRLAQVIQVNPHPHADMLLVCQIIDQYQNSYQVVCGDTTLKVNDRIIYAPNNSYIPSWNNNITTKNIRNVESQGMICSLAELGLMANNQKTGVHILPPETELHFDVAEALDINMPILDLEITPNRSDCMSILGIARELQAYKLGTITQLIKHDFYDRLDKQISVKIIDNSCFIHMSRVIVGCNNNLKTPSNISNRLRSANIMPVNPVVDIVNYITHIIGIPLQVFDLDCLQHSSITIENLKKSEVMPTISNGLIDTDCQNYIKASSRQLPKNSIVMRHGTTIINVNGAFYNTNFMCNKNTKNLYLSIGYFNRENMAITNRDIGLCNDNSLRLERGLDYQLIKQSLDITTKYIIDILDGNVGQINISGDLMDFNVPIKFQLTLVQQLLGIKIPTPLIYKYLTNLGFVIHKINNNVWEVAPPSWREDCNNDADLIEEIARMHSYDTLGQKNYIKLEFDFHNTTTMQQLIKKIMQVMVSRQGHEIITTPFISNEEATAFNRNGNYDAHKLMINSTHKSQNTVRSSLLPGLLRCLDANITRGCDCITLYETGMIFCDSNNPKKQIMNTAIVRYGQKYKKYWGNQTRNQDVFDIRGDLDSILRVLGFDENQYCIEHYKSKPAQNSVYVPEYSGQYIISNTVVASFGLLNPEIHFYDQIKDQQIWIAELQLNNLLTIMGEGSRKMNNQSPYPTVRRDFCVIIEEKVQAQNLINSIKKIPLEADIEVYTFDYYLNQESHAPNHRSVTFGVDITPRTTTFTNFQIQKICDMITDTLVSQSGVKIRK